MHRTALTSVIIAAGLLAPAAPLRADVRYAVTDLGTLGGNTSSAAAVNATGQIVGSADLADGTHHAFLFSNGTMSDLGALGTRGSSATGINDSGQIVGTSDVYVTNYGHRSHAFLYQAGSMSDLGTLGGTNSYGGDINNSGLIVGSYDTGTVEYTGKISTHAFSYDHGTMRDLGTVGQTDSYANAVNSTGQIVGSLLNVNTYYMSAFLRNPDGTAAPVGPAEDFAEATDINDSGQIVGYSQAGPFALLSGNATVTNLGTLGGSDCAPSAINNLEQIVGRSAISGTVFHAFLYTTADGITDLNSLIDPSSGWTLTYATDINDSGLIVGTGTDPAGQTHAFLLTPTPEPASLSLLAFAATPLLSRRRRRYHPRPLNRSVRL